MIEEIKELFQSFVAPAIEGVRGDFRALDTKVGAVEAKLDAKIDALDTKIESHRRELIAEVHRVEQGMHAVEKTLSRDFARLEQKVDLSLDAMNQKLDLSLAAITGKMDLFLRTRRIRLRFFVLELNAISPGVRALRMCKWRRRIRRAVTDVIRFGATCGIHTHQVAHSLGNFMVGA